MNEIYSALAGVMADCDHVAKRDRNEHQRFLFRGIDAVVNAVGPVLRKHSVIVVPEVESVTYDTVATSTGKPATACRVLATYRFFARDGSSVHARVAAEAWDSGDKAAPKAMSVAFRTALLQALALPTDEPDPDSQTYERDNVPHRAETAPKPEKPMTASTRAALFATFTRKGIEDKAAQLAGINAVTGGGYTSRGDLTEAHAQAVIKSLAAHPDTAPLTGDDDV